MSPKKKDAKTFVQKTKNQMVIGFFILLFTVGIGLIWIFYGQNAALLGFLCLLGTLLPIGVIVLILNGVERVVK